MRSAIAMAIVLGELCLPAIAAETTQGGFFSASKASVNLRTFGFRNDNLDGHELPSRAEEWAQGAVLQYASGFTRGTVGFGLDALALAAVTLDSGGGRHQGSSMIPSDGDSASTTWARFAPTFKARLGETELRYGALAPKLPVLVANDGRVLPQTFQGTQVTAQPFGPLTLVGGSITRAVGRGSTDRTGLAVAGGSRMADAFYFAGGDWAVSDALLAQYYVARMEDYYTQHFVGFNHRLPLGEGRRWVTDIRAFKTDSIGANSTAAGRAAGYETNGYTSGGTGKIDNRTWSVSGEYQASGHALMLGYQAVSAGSNFVQPNQGALAAKGAGGASSYLLTDRYIQAFNRAGEQTVFAQYAFDFAAVGLLGLKASVMYLKGYGVQTVGAGTASEWERDLVLDYVIQSGALRGVGLGWRNARSHSGVTSNQDLNRLFLSYSIPLL